MPATLDPITNVDSPGGSESTERKVFLLVVDRSEDKSARTNLIRTRGYHVVSFDTLGELLQWLDEARGDSQVKGVMTDLLLDRVEHAGMNIVRQVRQMFSPVDVCLIIINSQAAYERLTPQGDMRGVFFLHPRQLTERGLVEYWPQ